MGGADNFGGGPKAGPEPERRLVMLASTDDSCRTFIFKGESHTLGNALKGLLLSNPSVTFCGYSIPHPAEDQMFLRIQTVEGVPAQDVLRKAFQVSSNRVWNSLIFKILTSANFFTLFQDLKAVCQITKKTFQTEMDQFKAQN